MALFSKLFSKLQKNEPESPQDQALSAVSRPEVPDLKLIIFIVDWNQTNVLSGVFEEEKVRFHFISKGRGTASSDVLNLLGIGADDKAVVFCIEQAVMAPVLIKEARKRLSFQNPGTGIAFTVPLSAINSPILRVFKQSVYKSERLSALIKNQPKSEGGTMAEEHTHDLIISVINQGYSDEFMNTAKAAGASGGTVLNARGQAHEGAVKFFGISVQDEKEIIIMLTSREKKVAIMRAISEAHGLNSKAQGIVFSLPVDNAVGLNLD